MLWRVTPRYGVNVSCPGMSGMDHITCDPQITGSRPRPYWIGAIGSVPVTRARERHPAHPQAPEPVYPHPPDASLDVADAYEALAQWRETVVRGRAPSRRGPWTDASSPGTIAPFRRTLHRKHVSPAHLAIVAEGLVRMARP